MGQVRHKAADLRMKALQLITAVIFKGFGHSGRTSKRSGSSVIQLRCLLA
jgi:hypothetical protein